MKCIRKRREVLRNHAPILLWKDVKTAGIAAMCQLWAFFTKETEHLLKCSDARTNGDPVCRSLVIRREPLEENILGLVHQYAASMLEKRKESILQQAMRLQRDQYRRIAKKQSRQLTSEKMKLYDDYKDGRMDRDLYKQRAEKISGQLDEIKRKIEDAENSKSFLNKMNFLIK